MSMKQGMIVDTFKGYLNFPAICSSVAIFILVKYIKIDKIEKLVIKIVSHFTPYTFSIYLLHFFVMDICNRLFKFSTYSISYRLFMPILIIGLCIGITKVIRMIPILNKVLP